MNLHFSEDKYSLIILSDSNVFMEERDIHRFMSEELSFQILGRNAEGNRSKYIDLYILI